MALGQDQKRIDVDAFEPVGMRRREPADRDQRPRERREGVRGAPRCDILALAQTLVAVGRFAAAHANELESIDINPFLVLPEGQGAVALDALIVNRVEK